jgi:hypothetical protein
MPLLRKAAFLPWQNWQSFHEIIISLRFAELPGYLLGRDSRLALRLADVVAT